MKPNDVQGFYDAFAASYHLIFADWQRSVKYQGEVIDQLIQTELASHPRPVRVLDCTCGIGTQVLGLAQHANYEIHATDISPAEIERAKEEAHKAGVNIAFGVADIRTLDEQVAGEFDVVLSFDNAIPHLLIDADLEQALTAIYAKLKPQGIFMASIRDYDALLTEQPKLNAQRVMEQAEGKRVTLQYWEWVGEIYTVNQFILQETAGTWALEHFATQYRALQRAVLSDALAKVGFTNVHWLMPEDSDYYQPIVIACHS